MGLVIKTVYNKNINRELILVLEDNKYHINVIDKRKHTETIKTNMLTLEDARDNFLKLIWDLL